MTSSIDDILAGHKPARMSVPINLRADLLARHAELKRAHSAAIRDDMSSNAADQAPKILDQLRTLETELAEAETLFTFEALGGQEYKQLRAAFPPSKDHRRDGFDFNPNTFPTALIAACSVDPVMTLPQAKELEGILSDGQFAKLWNTAISVNIGDDSAPKSVLPSALAGSSDGSSSTASPEESPGASSLDE